MTEETTEKKRRLLEESAPFSDDQFGPEQIVEMNKDLPESTITLYLPPDFDKKFLPAKARTLRHWWEKDEKTRMHARFCLPLTMASGLGYYILSPATFTVEWDGEANHDTELTIIDGASHAQIDNHSSFGSFTVQARFIVRTKNIGDFIYIKGVANQYRQPFNVMEAMIESWWSPSEFGVVCLVNQPGKFTIQKGEPLAQMFVVSAEQAQYGLGIADGYPPFWQEWTDRRNPEIYDGRNMDYLRGVLPDQTPVCPHMKSWSEGNISQTIAETSVDHLWANGDNAVVAGNFDEAVRHYNRAMQLAEDKGEMTEELLQRLSGSAFKLQEKGQYPQSIRLMQKCVDLGEQYFGGLHFTSEVLNDIGYSYRSAGDLNQARKYYEQSLARKRSENAPPLSLARALIDLGTLHDFQLRREQAMPLLSEAKEIYAKHLPVDDPQHLYLKNVFGCLLTHIGQFDEAEKLYFEVIEHRSRLLGEDSLDVADTYNDLGFHYKDLKKFQDAEVYFKKCLSNRQKHLGMDALDVAAAHEDLSWLYRESGDFDKARKELEQVLAIQQKRLFRNEDNLRGTYSALADVCTALGDLDAAQKYRAGESH